MVHPVYLFNKYTIIIVLMKDAPSESILKNVNILSTEKDSQIMWFFEACCTCLLIYFKSITSFLVFSYFRMPLLPLCSDAEFAVLMEKRLDFFSSTLVNRG
jgi:hypothetical protein